MSLQNLVQEKVWLDKSKYADAERIYYEKLSKVIKFNVFNDLFY